MLMVSVFILSGLDLCILLQSKENCFCSLERGYPKEVVKSLVPLYNSLVFFEVNALSFHQVFDHEKCLPGELQLYPQWEMPSVSELPPSMSTVFIQHLYLFLYFEKGFLAVFTSLFLKLLHSLGCHCKVWAVIASKRRKTPMTILSTRTSICESLGMMVFYFSCPQALDFLLHIPRI